MTYFALWWRRRASWMAVSAPIGVAAVVRQNGWSPFCSCSAASVEETENRREWFALPPYSVEGASTMNDRQKSGDAANNGVTAVATTTTAFKWIVRCCPNLPKCLVHKLFRTRKVKIESLNLTASSPEADETTPRRLLRRVSAKDSLKLGDKLFLPLSNQNMPIPKDDRMRSLSEANYIQSLELYRDSAILVINKPAGMPVQGGPGIKKSLDLLASTSLKYDSSESPRLVHRLDRDSSGVLVMGRTQASTLLLHSIFREKTSGTYNSDAENIKRILQKKYWALVLGTPRRARGMISAPLAKVVVDDGKSERITICDDAENITSKHAITEYQVLKSSIHGLTWLELSPLTGRKHQLRVHCAEALGTPIVGDYKYGWRAHKKWTPLLSSNNVEENKKPLMKSNPICFDVEGGSVLEEKPALHLHCRQMIIPKVELALKQVKASGEADLSKVDKLDIVAPLPFHMQKSWDILFS